MPAQMMVNHAPRHRNEQIALALNCALFWLVHHTNANVYRYSTPHIFPKATMHYRHPVLKDVEQQSCVHRLYDQ